MPVVHNDDRAGNVGVVGMAPGILGISISSMVVGPSAYGHSALLVFSTAGPVPSERVEHLPTGDGILSIKRSASRRGRYGSTRAVPVIAVVSGAGRCSCPAARWPTSRAPARWPMASTRRTGRRAIPQRKRNERRRPISDGSPMPRWIKGRPVSVRGRARGPSGGLGAGPRDGTSPRTGHHGEVGSRRPPGPYLGGPGPRAFARLPKSPATRSRSVFSAWQV